MNKIINFVKMHGLGNDFIVVEDIEITKDLVCELADRNRGIGFDQLLLIKNKDKLNLHADVEVYNADGTTARFCGNGFRCLIKYFSDKVDNKDDSIKFDTVSGEVIGNILENEASILFPMDISVNKIDLDIDKDIFDIFLVNTGNEHAVCLCNENIIKMSDIEKNKYIISLYQKIVFELGRDVNVFAVYGYENDNMDSLSNVNAILYERGTGITQACGSGAAAISAVCKSMFKHREFENKLLNSDLEKIIEKYDFKSVNEQFQVKMPGGILKHRFVENKCDDIRLWQTGEIRYVFKGEIDILNFYP